MGIPPDSRLTRLKTQWAQAQRQPKGAAGARLPPGQHEVRDWPVLDLGEQPEIARQDWRLAIEGLVARPQVLDWAALMEIEQVDTTCDIHCVTSWSRFDNRFTGITTHSLLDRVQPLEQARAVLLYGSDGYTTNLPLTDFAHPDALLAHSWQGAPLTTPHGGPVRLVLPHLYFWKSAKWLRGIEFLAADEPGFWEERGYHMRGDPWAEERYGAPG